MRVVRRLGETKAPFAAAVTVPGYRTERVARIDPLSSWAT